MPSEKPAEQTAPRFWGWGDVGHRFDSHAFSRLLGALKGPLSLADRLEPPFHISVEDYALPPSKLPEVFIQQWSQSGLSLDPAARVTHAVGKSYKDLLRLRLKQVSRFPDGVFFIQSAGQLAPLFQAARKHKITLIPFGGGTGVVGGTECVGPAERPVLVLNLRRLNKMEQLDPVSQTAVFQAGILGPELERKLNEQGYTLGHFPQSFEFSTLGGWVVTRSAGQNSTKYGKIEKLVAALNIHTPAGGIATKSFPATATGPSLTELLVGSEGIYGVLTDVTVRVSKMPQAKEYLSAFFTDFSKGIECVRACLQENLRPSVIRLSDEIETRIFSQMSVSSAFKRRLLRWWLNSKRMGDSPCYLLLGVEGPPAEVKFLRSGLEKAVRQNKGVLMGRGQGMKQGKKWEVNRFELPYLRDDLMDQGVFIDTLETSAPWAALLGIHREMREAFNPKRMPHGEHFFVGCHLSHAYPDGASLYFTLIGKQRKGAELKQWEEVKKIATDVLVREGGSLSHHHGVGLDHRAWMIYEKPPLGLTLLQKIKDELDPDGLLNPGKLI